TATAVNFSTAAVVEPVPAAAIRGTRRLATRARTIFVVDATLARIATARQDLAANNDLGPTDASRASRRIAATTCVGQTCLSVTAAAAVDGAATPVGHHPAAVGRTHGARRTAHVA